MTTSRPLPDHGTLSRHKYHGCKCEPCVTNYRAYQRNRHRKVGYGTWQPLVDAEPVRQHLLHLREHGIAFTRVAELTGLHTATVGGFLYALGPKRPRKKRATPEIAAKILAIKPGTASPGIVDGTGTRRRIQALVANGWPMRALGPHIGVNPATVCRLAAQQTLYSKTAEAVAAAYRQLRDENPEDHGITPGSACKARNTAARRGWAGPAYWDDDDFDNPDFQPATSDEVGRLRLGRHRLAEIEHLDICGIPEHEIAERLDMRPQYVHDIVRELRAGRLTATVSYLEAA